MPRTSRARRPRPVPVDGISPFLWFDHEAEDAARFYTSLFANSRIRSVTRYTEAGPGAPGSVMLVEFTLDGRSFTALNGGPGFRFTPAVSLVVHCRSQAQVDRLWEGLTAGGTPGRCGWLEDRFGLSWQVVPERLGELLRDPDREKVTRVVRAILTMGKLDVRELERAARPR